MEESVVAKDVIYEILKKVDAPTLAAAGAACSHYLRSIAGDEKLWEALCELQWPSTKNSQIKSLIISVGGFRKFFVHSFPLPGYAGDYGGRYGSACRYSGASDYAQEASEFVSIVAVAYKGREVFSKMIEGFPDNQLCFLDGPFWIDAIDSTTQKGLQNKVEFALDPSDCKLKNSDFARNVEVSWILVNRATKQIRNLCGLKPYRRQDNWPVRDEVDAVFGAIFPVYDNCPSESDILSSVTIKMKCRNRALVEIKSLSFHLSEISYAGHLNVAETLEAFYWMLNRPPCLTQSPRYIVQRMNGHGHGHGGHGHGHAFAFFGIAIPLFALALFMFFYGILFSSGISLDVCLLFIS